MIFHMLYGPCRPRWGAKCAAGFLLLLGLARGVSAQDAPPAQDPLQADLRRSLQVNVPDGFTVAAVGDMQLVRPVSKLRDSGFQATLRWIGSADVAFGNLETTLADMTRTAAYPQATLDSLRPLGAPEIASDLRAMGFTLVSRANNHALDWGLAAMQETDRLLDEAGVVHAGTGPDLAAARAARYLDTPSGRVALISLTSTFEETASALAPLGEAPARPGVNSLHTRMRVIVDHATMHALLNLQAQLPTGAGGQVADRGPVTLFGTTYDEGDHVGFAYDINPVDFKEVIRAIRQGKLTSDFLIVNVHSHDPGNWSLEPADFFQKLARAAIDAGADMVIGEGPHQLRGIEIYSGKPIFYSLGNFFFQIAPQQPVAADLYQKLGGDPDRLTDAELNQSRIGVHVEQESWAIGYESVVALTSFRNGRVWEIQLHPIELSRTARMADRGIARAADPAIAEKILQRLARLSAPYGTKIDIHNGLGTIREAVGK